MFGTGCGSEKKQVAGESSKETYERLVKAVETNDWGSFYDILEDKAQASINEKYEIDHDPRFKGMKGKTLFVAAMTSEPPFVPPAMKTPLVTQFKDEWYEELTKAEEQGDQATLSVRNKKSGREDQLTMHKQEGRWRLKFK
ncbi:MAG: hypothetical protein K8T89_12895 [Planctomycetes bacterium]|nr:hypothetical protein [Planctomycetota bacterium]